MNQKTVDRRSTFARRLGFAFGTMFITGYVGMAQTQWESFYIQGRDAYNSNDYIVAAASLYAYMVAANGTPGYNLSPEKQNAVWQASNYCRDRLYEAVNTDNQLRGKNLLLPIMAITNVGPIPIPFQIYSQGDRNHKPPLPW